VEEYFFLSREIGPSVGFTTPSAQWIQGALPQGMLLFGINLTSYLYLMPKLRLYGAMYLIKEQLYAKQV
jgi:hypothetical protein